MIPKPPLRGEQRTIALAMRESQSLVVEVARQSRDGRFNGLCYVAIPGFFPRLEAQPIAATPQALRASSPSRGAFKGPPARGWRLTRS